MPVNVLIPTILIASTSYIQPVVGVDYVYPVAQVEYTQPVFRANYLQIRVTAEVTMPDFLGVEVLTPTDLVTLATTKAFADSTDGFTDATTQIVTKGLTDSFTMLDSVDIEYWIEKNLADTQTIIESLIRSVSKPLPGETVTSTDLATRAITKALAEVTAGFVDQITGKSVTKGLTDSFTMLDSVDIEYWIEKNLADTQAIADLAAISFSRPVSDTAAAADAAPTRAVSKAVADALSSPTDAISSFSVQKAVTDSATVAESISILLTYIRLFSDSTSNIDATTLANLLGKTETLVSSDDDILNVSKGLSEGLHLIDNMDGDIEYNIVKLVGELITSSDTQNIVFSNQVVDNVLTSSNGTLTMQDYSDITYFLTDYVGTSRAFA